MTEKTPFLLRRGPVPGCFKKIDCCGLSIVWDGGAVGSRRALSGSAVVAAVYDRRGRTNMLSFRGEGHRPPVQTDGSLKPEAWDNPSRWLSPRRAITTGLEQKSELPRQG